MFYCTFLFAGTSVLDLKVVFLTNDVQGKITTQLERTASGPRVLNLRNISLAFAASFCNKLMHASVIFNIDIWLLCKFEICFFFYS